jgi:aminocarboxymuconate-semialdehyde decarboxylase
MSAPLPPLEAGPIDVHSHIVPEALLSRIAAANREGFSVETVEGGRRRVTLGGRVLNPPLMPAMTDMALRLADMDKQGVTAQILSPWVQLCGIGLNAEDAAWVVEATNAEIAAVVRGRPGRFRGFGGVPLQHPDVAVEALRRAMAVHGMLGVEGSTTPKADLFLDDPSLEPFWGEAEKLGAIVMLHPPQSPATGAFSRFYMQNLVLNPIETTVAGAHLIFGGVMERHPDLTVLLVHGGGFLPYNLGRLRRGHKMRAETKGALQGTVEDSFRRFVIDTVTHSASGLAYLYGEAGENKVVLGTDYPFDMADPDPVGTLRDAGLPAADTQRVLEDNTAALIAAVERR